MYSVVIPVFNRKATLERAVSSTFEQSVPPAEVILVDDCSTDGSRELIGELAAADPRVIQVLLPRNSGAPTARNEGARIARHDLIAFLDSDDKWKKTKAERQIAALEANPNAPAAFTNVEYWYGGINPRRGSIPPLVHHQDLFIRNVLGGTSSVMVRKAAFLKVDGFLPDMPACQDWDLWLRLAQLGPMPVVQEHLTEYHFDGGGRLSKNRERVEQGHARIFAQVDEHLRARDDARRIRAGQQMRLAEVYVRQFADGMGALRRVGTALRLAPSLRNFYKAGRIAALFVASSVRP